MELIKKIKDAEKQAKEILSLPVFPELSDEQVNHVIDVVRRFFN